MPLLSTIFSFVFGLMIGSFLNALVYRMKIEKSIIRGRSECVHCGHELSWIDLFPVLSFILLRGRCRYCQGKISWQYPMVELITGLLFAAAFFRVLAGDGGGLDSGSYLLVTRDWLAISILIAIFVYDWKWMLIPNKIVIPSAILIAVINLFLGYSFINLLIAVAVGFGIFAVQYYASNKRWVGGGDMVVGAFIGAFLGWPLVVVALFVAYILGAIISVVLLALKKATGKTMVPFGVFLAPAAIIALFWGERLLSFYLGRL